MVLKERFARGALDVILTTEPGVDPGGEPLASEPLVWIGAHERQGLERRPLPLGTVAGCIFNRASIETLNAAGFDWKLEHRLGRQPGDGRQHRRPTSSCGWPC